MRMHGKCLIYIYNDAYKRAYTLSTFFSDTPNVHLPPFFDEMGKCVTWKSHCTIDDGSEAVFSPPSQIASSNPSPYLTLPYSFLTYSVLNQRKGGGGETLQLALYRKAPTLIQTSSPDPPHRVACIDSEARGGVHVVCKVR